MRLFYFQRDQDVSGVSGIGRVLEGVLFTDGTVAIRWLSKFASTAVYNSLTDFEAIHDHDGKGHIVWV